MLFEYRTGCFLDIVLGACCIQYRGFLGYRAGASSISCGRLFGYSTGGFLDIVLGDLGYRAGCLLISCGGFLGYRAGGFSDIVLWTFGFGYRIGVLENDFEEGTLRERLFG